MSLASGDRLDHFEIMALIGKGGMGEVYKARDTRLGRDVAIKVSAEQFSERFQLEARAIASLNHSNICTLYDVGPNYLVMEYIEGEMPKGPLPVDSVIAIARQLAEALDVAHEQGVIHRDLKPGNLKITPDGKLKVLDFGLAKVAPVTRPGMSSENSPTFMSMTEAGMIVGTAAYMAPEQAKGRPVDKRADIWAYGVVLYELSTGKRVFNGEDASDVLASVLRETPDFEAVPLQIRAMLKRCLEKDPKKRLRDIADAAYLIGMPVAAVEAASSPSLKPAKLPWVLASLATAAALILAALYVSRPAPAPAEVVRFSLSPSPGYVLNVSRGGSPQFAVSPDGRYVVFVADNTNVKETPSTLWVRGLAR